MTGTVTNGMKIRLAEASKSAFLASKQRFRLLNFMAFGTVTYYLLCLSSSPLVVHNPRATESLAIPKSPATHQSVALQFKMLIKENGYIMMEIGRKGKKKKVGIREKVTCGQQRTVLGKKDSSRLPIPNCQLQPPGYA